MKFRLGLFGTVVIAILASDLLGNIVGNIVEVAFKAVVLAFLMPLIFKGAWSSQPTEKPSRGLLARFWNGGSEPVIDYQSRQPEQPAKADKKKRILAALANREVEALGKASEEELRRQLAELG